MVRAEQASPPIKSAQPPIVGNVSLPRRPGGLPRTVSWTNPKVGALLEVAAECFAQGGFAATTLSDIGDTLGLRKSIVHYYFKSKATLVKEVHSYAHERYLDLIRRALTQEAREQASDSTDESLNDQSEQPPQSGTVARSRDSQSASAPATLQSTNLAGYSQPRSPHSLGGLWAALKQAHSIRGLNVKLWSDTSQNSDHLKRAKIFEMQAHALLEKYFIRERAIPRERARDFAVLTLALLDGLTVREERAPSNCPPSVPPSSVQLSSEATAEDRTLPTTEAAFAAFVELLENQNSNHRK